jgi:hypothetical protein
MRKIVLAVVATIFFAAKVPADIYYISSVIDDRDVGLFNSISNDLFYSLFYEPGFGYAENFSLGGHVIDTNNDGVIDAGGRITLFGTLTFFHVATVQDARVTFNVAGRYVTGVYERMLFDEGTILVETRGPSLKWVLAETIDAADQPLSFLEAGDSLVLNSVKRDERNVFHVIPFLAASDFSDILFSEVSILGVPYHYGLTFGGDVILQTP